MAPGVAPSRLPAHSPPLWGGRPARRREGGRGERREVVESSRDSMSGRWRERERERGRGKDEGEGGRGAPRARGRGEGERERMRKMGHDGLTEKWNSVGEYEKEKEREKEKE